MMRKLSQAALGGATTAIALVCMDIALATLGLPCLPRLHAAEPAAAPSVVPAASTDAASQVVLPPGKKLGEKSTVHRFVRLRAGAVKTAKGWNVQDFASSFFNPNAEEITVTMKLVADDPKFVFANGQGGTFTKTYKFRPMHGDTDNIYIGSPSFGKPAWPVAPLTNFTGSVEFTGTKPFYYYYLRQTDVGEAADATDAYFAAWRQWVDDVPAAWDDDLGQFVIPYTNYWHHEKSWPVGWHSLLSITNNTAGPVSYTLKHIPMYGGQFNSKTGQITRYKEQQIRIDLAKGQQKKATLQDLFGWSTEQMSSMEGALLIRPNPLAARAGTAIRFSVPPNQSGTRMHEAIR